MDVPFLVRNIVRESQAPIENPLVTVHGIVAPTFVWREETQSQPRDI